MNNVCSCGKLITRKYDKKCSTCRVRAWRNREGFKFMSLSLDADMAKDVARLAKRQGVSKNEMVLTFIEWGIENESASAL